MNLDKIVVGNYQTNCYILSIGDNCLVIDPGDEYYKIKARIENKKVLGVLITHSHFDHVGALDDLLKEYNVETYQFKNLDEKEYKIGDFLFKVIYTFGHTNDSITFYFENEKIMFTGDFIFENSIGGTDLPTGDFNEMLKSIELIKK